jgi:hypothetical protein
MTWRFFHLLLMYSPLHHQLQVIGMEEVLEMSSTRIWQLLEETAGGQLGEPLQFAGFPTWRTRKRMYGSHAIQVFHAGLL